MRFYCTQHWDAAKLAAKIMQAADWAHRNHAFVLAGEFGATQRLNTPARLAWPRRGAQMACEQNAIGWTLWGYDDLMGFALTPASAVSAA